MGLIISKWKRFFLFSSLALLADQDAKLSYANRLSS